MINFQAKLTDEIIVLYIYVFNRIEKT